jgi:hypothetical protein
MSVRKWVKYSPQRDHTCAVAGPPQHQEETPRARVGPKVRQNVEVRDTNW